MSYIRVDMIDGDFQLDNFFAFRKSKQFQELANDWEQVQTMCLDRNNDREYFDLFYNQSLEIADVNEKLLFLIPKMYISKYPNLMKLYPTIQNFLKFIIKLIKISTHYAEAECNSSNSDSLFNILMIFQEKIVKFSGNYAPADFAVLFIKDSPKFGPVEFYGSPPEASERVHKYKGVILSFSKKIICEAFKDERIHNYTHLKLPESLDRFIVSILPGKRLTEEIKGWEVPTPYNLSESKNTKEVFIGLNPTKNVNSLSLCSINDLNIISYDTNDLDIRTFADLIFTWF